MTQAQQQEDRGEVALYETPEGGTALEVRLYGDTEWLTQKQMGELFGKNVRTVSEHIRNVFKERELDESSVIRKFRINTADGKSFSGGNKRIGSFLFIDFLNRNGRLFRNGEPVINDVGLAALALLVAESDPKDKDAFIRLVTNMLGGEQSS